jgi:hypothetical protein
MRIIVVAAMIVILWAVPSPAADSGFKQGASEVGTRKGQRRSERERRKPVKRSRKKPKRSLKGSRKG